MSNSHPASHFPRVPPETIDPRDTWENHERLQKDSRRSRKTALRNRRILLPKTHSKEQRNAQRV